MVHINEIADNLTSKAESINATSLGTGSPNNSMKMPPPNKMYLLNAHCEKSMAQEVQIYFKSFQEFVHCENDRLKVIISALNVTNVGHYNDRRIKYPGFMLEPLPVDINKLVQVIQSIYPAQVVQYSLGASKKDEAKASDAAPTGNKNVNNVCLFPPKGKDQVGLFQPNSSPKNHNKSNGHLRNFDMDQLVKRSMNKDHTSHQIDMTLTGGVGQDHQKLVHKGRDIDRMLLIEDTGMMVILTDQIVAIVIN